MRKLRKFIPLFLCLLLTAGSFSSFASRPGLLDEQNLERARQTISEHLSHPRKETDSEKRIRSYVQVPFELYPDMTWTGNWNSIQAAGQLFSGFGCGICSLSNISSTLLNTTITPGEMFELCKEHSGYRPKNGVGAIDWTQIKEMCSYFGLDAKLKYKPKDYAVFQQNAKENRVLLALVCKYNDDALWWYTYGHYITLWEYDETTDTVFVADSSGLYNRQRVPLKNVYDALKTNSQAQYMIINR